MSLLVIQWKTLIVTFSSYGVIHCLITSGTMYHFQTINSIEYGYNCDINKMEQKNQYNVYQITC